MRTHRSSLHSSPLRSLRATAALAISLIAAASFAADAGMADAQAKYEKEKAACVSGRSGQDRATCMKEAGAALDETRRGRLDNSGNLSSNATMRCDGLPAADRQDCMARINAGSAEGSVKGGGMIHETVTPVTPPSSR